MVASLDQVVRVEEGIPEVEGTEVSLHSNTLIPELKGLIDNVLKKWLHLK